MASRVGLDYRPATMDDLPFASRAATAQSPHHPVPEDTMRQRWRSAEGGGSVRRWIVSRSEPIGWISVVVPDGAEGHGYLNVLLPCAGADTLDDAYEFAEQRAREMGVTSAAADVWEDLEIFIATLHARGWATRRRQRHWRLELAEAADRLRLQHAAAMARVAESGIRIASAAELGTDAIYPELHRVHNASQADIPRSVPYQGDRWEVWLAWMEPPLVLPERVWVALADGRPVGYSFLQFASGGHVETGYTGVLREHRGKGVARALKLATLVQGLELGVDAVETDNDSENAPILHLNEELGYREITSQLELMKDLNL